ncbi:MAG TPA: IMP dehydrogenase, partial [Pseudomonadota bacterium]|nr:IMP dehydrogenase [Pseudomonadota bacterium]
MFPRGITFDDVLLVPGYNGIRSRQAVTTSVQITDALSLKIPVVSSNMDTITGWQMAASMAKLGGLGILHRFMSIEQNVADYRKASEFGAVGISLGVSGDAMERAEALVSAGASILCVDVAHGHSKMVNQTVRQLRERFGDNVCIIAGNVATYAGADYLSAAGA